MAGAGAMCILGIIDDIIELDWMAKLGGQVLIAGGMAFGGVQLASFPIFGLTLGSSRLWLFVSVFFIVGIMNAVDFVLTGSNGLAAGMIAIGAGILLRLLLHRHPSDGRGLLRDDRQPHRDRAARGVRGLPLVQLPPLLDHDGRGSGDHGPRPGQPPASSSPARSTRRCWAASR